MQKLFDEVGSLDTRCYEEFALNEDILMEHAANGIATFIQNKFSKGSSVLIVCGAGNNGADGLALARLLHKDYDVSIFTLKEAKSTMAKLQDKRCHAIHVKRTIYLNECDVIVDAIFGTGFKGKLDIETKSVLQTLNTLQAYKIACDVPSANTFVANTTLTMGALKKSLYNDQIKDFVGDIQVLDLGLSREIYEIDSPWHLLDFSDLKLPLRKQEDTHKGSFGHLCVVAGNKIGASILTSLSALNFGVGLVTLLSQNKDSFSQLPFEIMIDSTLPKNTTALALGMGLGVDFNQEILKKYLNNTLPLVVDADLFHMEIILEILQRKSLVLTPHPKEFLSLLRITQLADIDMKELQAHRFKYVELFCQKYQNAVLLLKGANVIIGKEKEFFINPHGSAKLAKGGSGDVLSGLIASLLAQEYTPLDASISASLAHTKLAQNYTGADFSLTPKDLIEGIGNL